ncbi:MAG: SGNH/GDSL hydrolase family protein [Planctomycetota bacterium]|nr:MAG: SGNH/GDSL hydrolase family protein [Planctomycetota bacterium]
MSSALKRRLLIACASAAACIALLEGGLRVAGFAYAPPREPIILWDPAADAQLSDSAGLHQASVRQLWEPRPLAAVPWGAAQGERIASDSHRGPERALEKRAGALRVATLGDSSTFGMGVPWPDCYSAQLEALLARPDRPCEVLDFGVIGFTVRQGIERWRERASAWKPDVVVLAFGAFNDHVAAVDKSDEQRIADGAAAVAGWRGCVRDLREHSRAFQLAARVADRGGAAKARDERWAAVLAERKRLDKKAGWPEFDGVRRVAPQEFSALLAELSSEIRASGARVVLVSVARRPHAEAIHPVLKDYSARVEAAAKELALPLVDARAVFRAHGGSDAGVDALFLEGDPLHPNRAGHALLAAALAEAIDA